MGEGLELGKSMPAWLLFPATFLAIVVLIYPFYQVRSVIARYTLFALSFRYLAGAHHAITFQASPIGISWNAVGSSTVFAVGLLLIRLKHLLLKPTIPFYAVLSTIMLSAWANHDILGSADAVDDLLGSAEYKTHIITVLLSRGLSQAVQGNGRTAA